MKVAYNGDHESVTLFGVTFSRGVPTAISGALALQKLPRNPDFVVCEESTEPDQADDKDTLIAALAARGVKADRRWSVGKLQAALDAD